MVGFFNVIDFGADNSGERKSTNPIQAAVDAVERAGGGTVFFPPGTYVSGTIELCSNITFHLSQGSMLLGSPDFDDYSEQNEGHIPPEFPFVRCLFVGFDLENIIFTGGGTLDGRGDDFMDYGLPEFPDFDEGFTKELLDSLPEERSHEYVAAHDGERPTWIFFFRRCKNIKFHRFSIIDAARWTTRFSLCENLHISDMIIENSLIAANSDGMHFTSCKNIVISDCAITSGDDCIAVSNYGDEEDTENVVITNCILTSHSAGIRLGFGGATLQDINISNCIFKDCNRAIGIFAGKNGTTRNISISNVQMATRLIGGSWWGKAEPVFICTLDEGALIENIRFNHISALSEQGIVVHSIPDAKIKNLEFIGLKLTIKEGTLSQSRAGTLDLLPHSMTRQTMAPLYFSGVENLNIKDAEIKIEDSVKSLFRGGIDLIDCQKIAINGYREQ